MGTWDLDGNGTEIRSWGWDWDKNTWDWDMVRIMGLRQIYVGVLYKLGYQSFTSVDLLLPP